MEEKIRKVWSGWEIVQAIGRGSFGSVYKIQRNLGGSTEVAALKVISIPKDREEIDQLKTDGYDNRSIAEYFGDSRKKIENEYAMMANLKGHSNIVYCDDLRALPHEDGFGWDIYIKMELLTPLKKYLNGEVRERQVIKLGMDLCRALVLCQENNIVHRDIKPDNIFVSRDNSFKLGDFGIARTMEGTLQGTRTGTYDYMAPEVYSNRPYHIQADIYSLGIVMYWMLNDFATPFLPGGGKKPTPSMKLAALERRFSGQELPAPAHGSEALRKIVGKACQFDQKKRYQTPGEMLRDLEALLRNLPVGTYPQQEKSEKKRIIDAELAEDDKTMLTGKSGSSADPEQTVREKGNRQKKEPAKRTAAAKKVPGKGKRKEADKKGGRKWLIAGACAAVLLIAVALFFGGADRPEEVITEVPGDDYFVFEEVGFIEDKEKEISISADVLTEKHWMNTDEFFWYTYAGQKYPDATFEAVDYLGCGVYAGKTVSDSINSVSLLSSGGETLIPAEACLIEWAETEAERRYLLVYYAEEETTDKENFLICKTDVGIYTSNIDGTLYTGHIKLYDVKEKRFVQGLPELTGSRRIRICGNSIVIAEESGSAVLYDHEGNVLLEMKNSPSICGNILICSEGGTNYVYDETGTQTFLANKTISSVGNSGYIQMDSNGENVIMDWYGNVLLRSVKAYGYLNDMIVTREGDQQGLVSLSGQRILSNAYTYITDLGFGFTCARRGERYLVVGEEGIIATGLTSSPGNLTIEKDKRLYILNNRAYGLEVGESGYNLITEGLVSIASEENGLLGVFDLLTGKQLLPYEYERIRYAADHLYAYKNGGWEIYAVTLNQ